MTLPDQVIRIHEWRPICNLDERTPQLKFHVLHGSFHGSLSSSSSCGRPEESAGPESGPQILPSESDAEYGGLWSHLTADLLRKILLRLPSASLHRFRAVSKEWREMLSSSAFSESREALIDEAQVICAYEYLGPNRVDHHCFGPMVVIREGAPERAEMLSDIFTRNAGRTRRVHALDLSFVPSDIMGDRIKLYHDGFLRSFPSVFDCGHGSMRIINPFTRTWTTTPPLPEVPRDLGAHWMEEVMVDRASPSHFKAVAIRGDEEGVRWIINEFSSKTNNWRVTAAVDIDPLRPHEEPSEEMLQIEALIEPLPPYMYHRYLLHGEFLYVWKGNIHGDLFIYRLEDGSLVNAAAVGYPRLPRKLGLGKPYEVDLLGHDESGEIYGGWALECIQSECDLGHFRFLPCKCPLGFGITKLDRKRMRWEELIVLPEELFARNLEFFELSSLYRPLDDWRLAQEQEAVILGDFICFNRPSQDDRGVKLQNVFGFHIPSKTWQSFRFHEPRVCAEEANKFCLIVPKCLRVHLRTPPRIASDRRNL